MIYFNINKNNEFVLSEDNVLKHDELISVFLEEIKKSSVNVLDFKCINRKQYLLICKYNEKIINLYLYLKNITGAGWKEKPRIKRVQVSNLKEISPDLIQKEEQYYNVIIGVYDFDNNPIISCWDGYRYLNHKTVRSCYVTVDSLLMGYEHGFYRGVDSSQIIWIFNGEFFDRFLIDYINYIDKMRRKNNE